MVVIVPKTNKSPATVKPTILLLVAFWIFWGFGYQTLLKRLLSQVEGIVISRQVITDPIAPARYSTEYVVLGPDNQNHNYIAGPTDASLPRTIPVGTKIKKVRWRWSYEENGRQLDDFGWIFYLVVLTMNTACLAWALQLWHQGNRPPSDFPVA